VLVTILGVEKKNVLHILYVALFIQHAKRMNRFISLSVAYLAQTYFPHYLKEVRFSEEKKKRKKLDGEDSSPSQSARFSRREQEAEWTTYLVRTPG
jgi:hypothetical protein